MLAYLVFEIAAVWLFYPLGQVAEEDECGHLRAFEHGHIFYFHIFAFVGGWRICGYVFEHHAVYFGGGDDALAVFVDLHGGFEHLEDALFCKGRSEDDGEVGKRREAFAYCLAEMVDGGLRFVGYKVPFVHHNDKSFVVAGR